MGQKVHPYGFRLGVNKPWRSRWFSERDYDKLLIEDVKLKAELREKLKAAGVSSVEIERPGNKLRFLIRTARPGIVIGRKGAEIDKLKTELGKRTSRDVFIDIIEVNKPELDAQLVSENIALQLEKRVSFRRAMRKSVDSALRFGCKGIKVRVSGRLNGNEIARSEWYLQGRLPLHTLRADIDYGFYEARTTFGRIGVKVWIYRGEAPQTRAEREAAAAALRAGQRPGGRPPQAPAQQRRRRPVGPDGTDRPGGGTAPEGQDPVAQPVAVPAAAAEEG
jgi:small subunit ribosomal protein S3